MAADALDDLDRRVATDAGLLADSNNAGPLQDDVRRALNYKAGRKSEWEAWLRSRSLLSVADSWRCCVPRHEARSAVGGGRGADGGRGRGG